MKITEPLCRVYFGDKSPRFDFFLGGGRFQGIIYMNLNILEDFQIYISAPLSYFYLVYLFMSFLIYFFPFVFKFVFLSLVSELKISRSSHREEFLIIKILVRRRHFVRNFTKKGLLLYWKLAPS